ncbi:MAG TPA: type II CAAX endopeptidase family protein [Myxococcota bacterium]|nr:type II CAAX endopeptidase family protein [Myxococcota bacterium]HRY96541.1 type II CAAX endopeptidase family protein [Myxococcota bacterium]
MRTLLHELVDPLRDHGRALAITGAALALLLVYLEAGQRGFFLAHLAPRLSWSRAAPGADYWAALYQFGAAALLFLAVPLLTRRLWTGQSLAELGLGLGDRRVGFLLIVPAGLLLVSIPGALSAAFMPEFQAEYPLAKSAAASAGWFALYELAYGLLYYIPYEAFFRGFLQGSLQKQLGPAAAVCIQTAVTTLLHLGKPQGEIWSALLAGFVFGAVVLRTRSVWPILIVHWALGTLTDLGCAWSAGRF